MLFHVFVAILPMKAPWPYVVVVTEGLFKSPLVANEVYRINGRKYKPAIKDRRTFAVDIFADEKTIFNFNFTRKFQHFWYDQKRVVRALYF